MVGKASSEDVKDAVLDEAEEIGKGLEGRKIAHDADDLFFLEEVMKLEPDLVPRKPDYFKLFEKYKKKERGYTSHRAVAESAKLESHGTVGVQFRAIEDAILRAREKYSATEATAIPALDSERIAEIFKKGKLLQLDPRGLLPPTEHQHYKLSRYFQKRRAPRSFNVDLPILAASIGKIGMIEPPTVQEAGSHNAFIRRTIDGFGRLTAWMLADTEAGGSDKKAVLDYPVCLVVDCTDAEADLIALEKNQNKENFDLGDRDYSIVTMYERHKEVYTQKRLTELFPLHKKRISQIIVAWRDSYPWDQKKGETSLDNPIRRALEERKITTKHGEELARLQKWPSEQKRIANWLLEEVEKSTRKDAYLEEQRGYNETQGEYKFYHSDPDGISAGHLKMMVSKSVTNMEHAEAIQKVAPARLKDGQLEQKITPEEFNDFRAKISKERTGHTDGIPKAYVEKGLKAAGIRIVAPKLDVQSLKPVSPATAKAAKLEPVLVCKNCQLYFEAPIISGGLESCCIIGIEPTEDNECAVQLKAMGSPSYRYKKCLYCGGVTIDQFLKGLPVDTGFEKSKKDKTFIAHNLCVMDLKLKEFDIKGKCQLCINSNCELLDAVEHGQLDVEVKHCPEENEDRILWFTPRPDIIIEDINEEVKSRIGEFVTDARKDFEKTKAAGRAA